MDTYIDVEQEQCERMKMFSIKDLENFSCVKAHTIRTWEKRYGVLKPQRNIGNTRLYTLSDVKYFLDISLLIENGYKISHVAGMHREELNEKTFSLLTETSKQNKTIYQLIIATYAGDIDAFESILNQSVSLMGVDITIKNIIVPFLNKVQLLHYKDNHYETHFMVTAIRKKLILGLENLSHVTKNAKTAMLFLPENEHFDLLLLYMAYELKKHKFHILYLGTNVSKESLKRVIEEKKPDYIYTHATPKQSSKIERYESLIRSSLPNSKFHVAYSTNIIME